MFNIMSAALLTKKNIFAGGWLILKLRQQGIYCTVAYVQYMYISLIALRKRNNFSLFPSQLLRGKTVHEN
jgi:hypothetical protein